MLVSLAGFVAALAVQTFTGDPAVSAVVLFSFASRACRLAFFSQGGFALKLLFGDLLGFGDLVPNCLDCLDCC